MAKHQQKYCLTCNGSFDVDNYERHVTQCGLMMNTPPSTPPKTCPLCQKKVQDLSKHISICSSQLEKHSDIQQTIAKQNSVQCQTKEPVKKNCPVCRNKIDENIFAIHVPTCVGKAVAVTVVQNSTTNSSRNNSDNALSRSKTKPCIICNAEIAEERYEIHVDECLQKDEQSKRIPSKTTQERYSTDSLQSSASKRMNRNSCLSCDSPIDMSRGNIGQIGCEKKHNHCLKCLETAADYYIETKTPPVCHTTFCGYELSRYEVMCLPLKREKIEALVTCVTTNARTKCPFCSFYVETKAVTDLNQHAINCNWESQVICDYCHRFVNQNLLVDHVEECKNIPKHARYLALAEYLLPKVKYPSDVTEIQHFINYRNSHKMSLNPHEIIESLAQYQGIYPFDIPRHTCGVCLENCLYENIFVFGCKESHKVCYSCFTDSCDAKFNSNELLKCPLCDYQLLTGEINQLKVSNERKKELVEYQIEKSFTMCVNSIDMIIKCPKQNCKWVVEIPSRTEKICVTCRKCHHSFCSICGRDYHYNSTCQEVPQIEQHWFFWCNTERDNYWRKRAEQDENFRAQFENHQRQREANHRRNEELRQRYTELLADENFKAQHCRLCPHCQRIVQHLSGCDSMICGQNYHGGDVQSGCGKGFQWSRAQPYVPIANTGPEQVQMDIPPPKTNEIIVHRGIRCDSCQEDVQGIRFDCIQCPSLIFCEKCEQRATLEHSEQLRRENRSQHIFHLSLKPSVDEDEINFDDD